MVVPFSVQWFDAGKDVGKRITPPLLVGLQAGTTTLEIIPVVLFDVVLPEDPAIPLLGIYPKDAPTYKRDIHTEKENHTLRNTYTLRETDICTEKEKTN